MWHANLASVQRETEEQQRLLEVLHGEAGVHQRQLDETREELWGVRQQMEGERLGLASVQQVGLTSMQQVGLASMQQVGAGGGRLSQEGEACKRGGGRLSQEGGACKRGGDALMKLPGRLVNGGVRAGAAGGRAVGSGVCAAGRLKGKGIST